MEVHLSTTLFFSLFLFTTLLPSPPIAAAARFLLPPSEESVFPPTTGDPLPPTSDDTVYIHQNCETTRYPQTCITSLTRYSGNIQHNPGRLALAAIHVALTNVTHMANYVSNITLPANTSESSAINDCSSVFGDAVDQIYKSKREMKRIGWTGDSVRFQLSNVQTWMSAALTNEDTCTEGFAQVANGGVKKDVCDRVAAVMEVTSNALALVNSYADTITV